MYSGVPGLPEPQVLLVAQLNQPHHQSGLIGPLKTIKTATARVTLAKVTARPWRVRPGQEVRRLGKVPVNLRADQPKQVNPLKRHLRKT
jgi:hypothetical protein